jgi:phage/plasmid-associated DNA primase
MIEGFLEYQRIGLSPPPVVCAAAAEYRREQDNITQWIELAIEQDASHEPITLAELHSHYQAWMDAEMGWRGASNKRLAEALRQRGFESIITSSGVTAFRGIRLKWTKPAQWENTPF